MPCKTTMILFGFEFQPYTCFYQTLILDPQTVWLLERVVMELIDMLLKAFGNPALPLADGALRQ